MTRAAQLLHELERLIEGTRHLVADARGYIALAWRGMGSTLRSVDGGRRGERDGEDDEGSG